MSSQFLDCCARYLIPDWKRLIVGDDFQLSRCDFDCCRAGLSFSGVLRRDSSRTQATGSLGGALGFVLRSRFGRTRQGTELVAAAPKFRAASATDCVSKERASRGLSVNGFL